MPPPRARVRVASQDLPESALPSPRPTSGQLPFNPVFPSAIPTVVLSDTERQAKYGLKQKMRNAALKQEFKAIYDWAQAVTNDKRGIEYLRSVQSTTLEKMEGVMLGYLGYVARQFSVPLDRLRLEQYGDPMRVAFFIAFIIVSRQPVLMQCGMLESHHSCA